MNATVVFDPSSIYNTASLNGAIRMSQSGPNELVFIHVDMTNFPPNKKFACHVHTYGDLTKGCASACDHFNPFSRLHGRYEFYGPNRHVGDLAVPGGNLVSDNKGRVKVSFYDDLVSLYPSERGIIGRSIVIHEKADDGGEYRKEKTEIGKESGKTGNAGARIACAVIGLSPPS